MTRFSSARHPLVAAIAWDPARPAERVNDFIWMSRGTSSGYVVANDAGDVIINTGSSAQGPRYRERYEQALGRPLAVKRILMTQSHFDHIGGWRAFADPGADVVVQRDFPILIGERAALAPFFQPRAERILHAITPSTRGRGKVAIHPEPPEPLTLFADDYAFEVGGRRFEMIAAPSGETLDSAWVWLPDEKTVFTGNWMGALYGALPNFYTARGDRSRSISRFLRDIDRLISLEPELLLTGHDKPIHGQDRIRADLIKLAAAVRHIHDTTVDGMNAHKSLHTLMQEVTLPSDLAMAPGRGPVRWYVRMVWEEYSGWFHQDLTSELYELPATAVWAELAEMSGGADRLAERARMHLSSGDHLRALHLIEIAITAAPHDCDVRQTQIAILESLIDRTDGDAFDELGWLESQVRDARTALALA